MGSRGTRNRPYHETSRPLHQISWVPKGAWSRVSLEMARTPPTQIFGGRNLSRARKRTSAPRSEFDPKSVDLTDDGRFWCGSDQFRANLNHSRSASAKVGRSWPTLARLRPTLGEQDQFGPAFGQGWASSVNSGAPLTNVGRSRPIPARIRPNVSDFGRVRPRRTRKFPANTS